MKSGSLDIVLVFTEHGLIDPAFYFYLFKTGLQKKSHEIGSVKYAS